jgi:hypothetical protein
MLLNELFYILGISMWPLIDLWNTLYSQLELYRGIVCKIFSIISYEYGTHLKKFFFAFHATWLKYLNCNCVFILFFLYFLRIEFGTLCNVIYQKARLHKNKWCDYNTSCFDPRSGPFNFGNYWNLHEHIERMKAWVQLELCYFNVAWYII